MDILSLIQEALGEKAKGSKEGRLKGLASTKKKNHIKAQKSMVPEFDSIRTGAENLNPGDTFTTKNADRLYVVTKAGKNKDDKESIYAGGKTAKGFTPGAQNLTTGAGVEDVKAFGRRYKKKLGNKSKKNKGRKQ